MRIFGIIFCALAITACNDQVIVTQMDIQGHRGARGNLPENTIASMLFAVEAGVRTLELDVVISGDTQVVVSHEPWFSHEISLTPEGASIEKDSQMLHNLYQMDYATIRAYDVGSLGNDRFPHQEKKPAYKPLLKDLIDEIESFVAKNNLKPVFYNIEIKSHPQGDDLFHPTPGRFCQIVMKVLDDLIPLERYNIQSFDTRVLVWMNQNRPEVELAYLLESVEENKTILDKVEELSFVPEIISPHFELVDSLFVARVDSLNAKIIPWTVNNPNEMIRLSSLGVYGIITDYPKMGVELFGSYQ